jgi:hypothetical protein
MNQQTAIDAPGTTVDPAAAEPFYEDECEEGSATDDAPCVVPRSVVTQRLARLVLSAFVFTFLISRILVILIMCGRIPDMFLHLGQTHVHHLNYGIFLLTGTGAYLIFCRPVGKLLSATSVFYGIGLALTFDEFGIWLHLGGSYWQRASFDAVVIVAALLALIAYAPKLKRFKPRHWATAAVMVLLLGAFGVMLTRSVLKVGHHFMSMPRLIEIEGKGPS